MEKHTPRTNFAIKLVIILIILAESAVLAYLYKRYHSQRLATIAIQNALDRTMEAVHALQKDVADKAQAVSDLERRFSAAGASGRSMPEKQNADYLRKRLKESKEMELQMYERIEELSRKQAELESPAARPKVAQATPTPVAIATAAITPRPTTTPTATATLTPTPQATDTLIAQKIPPSETTAAAQPTHTPTATAIPAPSPQATDTPMTTTATATPSPPPQATDTPIARETPPVETVVPEEANPAGEITGQILILNETYNFVIVSVGSDNGVEAGDEGIVEHDGAQMGRVKVKKLYNKMCLADIVETSPDVKIRKNYLVKFSRGPENKVQ